jgi:alkylation response protein AidB-like acyl-CoA dehydrogenase
MDFTFNQDQIAFRESVSRFLMTEAAPEMLREIWETDVGRSPELRGKIASQGLMGLSVPEAEGGLGLGDIDWSLLTQELGYYAIPDSLIDTACIAAGMLAGLPTDHPVRARYLPRIVDGSVRIAIGHPINPWVADAHLADLLLLPHPGDGGLEIHGLDGEAVDIQAMRSIDASRRLATVKWEASPATRLSDGAMGQSLWDQTLNRGALCAAGQLVGLAQRMLDMTVDYASQRKQFGKPIGSFQAVKHHLADVVTKIEFAKPLLYRAAKALACGDADVNARVAHAKLSCGDAAVFAARKGIQVHGAMGYTWEVDLQMFMKRAWALDSAWGDRIFHQARLSEALLGSDTLLGPGATFQH